MRMLLWFEEMQHSTVKGFQSRAMVDGRVSPRDSQPMGIDRIGSWTATGPHPSPGVRVRPSCLHALFICLAELKHLKLHGLPSKAKVLKSFLVAQGALPMVVGCHSSELDCNWPSLCAGWRVSPSLIKTVAVPWIAGTVV